MSKSLADPIRRSRRRSVPKDGKVEGAERRMQIEVEASSGSAASEVAPFRWLWYILALVVPLAGVLIGLFLYDHDSRLVRLVGRNSLLVGFVVWILLPMALFFLLLLLGAVAMMDWVANVLPPVS
jgi:hypothetical protein